MKNLTLHRWFYPLLYFLLIIIALLPLYTENPYDSRKTQQVIFEILQSVTMTSVTWGWVFHLLTLAAVGLALWNPQVGGRAVALYFGANYWVVAALQTHAETPTYGFAVHTGALVADLLLGLLWLWVAWRNDLRLDFRAASRWRWLLAPLAVLTFWSPLSIEGGRAAPNFDPMLLLISPDYGLAYCFLTPVLLFLLIMAHPYVNRFALLVTAFNGLLYGLFNLSHWASPDTMWLGVLHLPLLTLSLVALWLGRSQ